MSMIRWEPFHELMSLRQAMDRLFEDSLVRPLGRLAELEQVPVDMYQTDTDVVVKASLPGVKPEDVDITISGDTLTIKGATKVDREIKRENYLRQEHRYGAFSRTMTLPNLLKTDKAAAAFESGVLTLTIPKREEAQAKSVKVKIQGVVEGKKD